MTRLRVPSQYNDNWGHVHPSAAEAAEGGRECCICLTHLRDVRFACGHAALCSTCLKPFLERAGPR